jgi:branched-chain amino acid transport system ATP-binding protein
VSIIGPNGAGKSTVLKTIIGFLAPSAGTVRFDGEVLNGLPPEAVLRRGVAYVPQGHVVFPQMTVLENLEMGAFLEKNRARVARAAGRVFGLFPILAERRRQPAGTLSGGEQQMLALGRALMIEPRMVLLDEPSLGLAPIALALIYDKLAELKASGMTMLIVEQNAAESLRLSDRGYVLELGRNRLEGRGPALLDDPEVKRLYLGG